MTFDELNRKISAHEAELQRYIRRKLPIKIGAKAKSVFQGNFHKGGSCWNLVKDNNSIAFHNEGHL